MTDLGLRWQKLRDLAGLDGVRIHDCRHTLASHAVMSGLDLYTVGRLLGHADIASTERYAHLADEHVREAAGRISGIVHGGMDRKRAGGRPMTSRNRHSRLTANAIAATKPRDREYTLWDAGAFRGAGASLGRQVLHRADPRPGSDAQDHPGAFPRDGRREGP